MFCLKISTISYSCYPIFRPFEAIRVMKMDQYEHVTEHFKNLTDKKTRNNS